jgi:uncharacterized protein (DUF433 family)
LDYDFFMNPNFDISNLLVRTPQGSWRIAGTRISLDSVVYSFCEGATPEEICQDFPGLSLALVYAAIAYYLNNREQVDRYLQEAEQSAEDLRQKLNSRHRDFLRDLRQRLTVARQSPTPA